MRGVSYLQAVEVCKSEGCKYESPLILASSRRLQIRQGSRICKQSNNHPMERRYLRIWRPPHICNLRLLANTREVSYLQAIEVCKYESPLILASSRRLQIWQGFHTCKQSNTPWKNGTCKYESPLIFATFGCLLIWEGSHICKQSKVANTCIWTGKYGFPQREKDGFRYQWEMIGASRYGKSSRMERDGFP